MGFRFRKALIFCSVATFLLLLMLICSTIVCAADPIRFAPLPLVSSTVTEQQFRPFSNYLAAISQQPVSLLHHESYQLLLEGMLSDKIDLAYLGPLPYVLLKRKDPSFVPLVRFVNTKGVSSYTCSLVSFDNELDLDKLSIESPLAMSQPYSTCAFLMTEHFLRQQGMSLKGLPYYYAGNHAESALDVIRGKAALAGVKTTIARKYIHLGLHVYEQNIELPGMLLVANSRTLSRAQIASIRNQLLALKPLSDDSDRKLTADWGREIRNGVVPVDDNDYQYIEQLLTEIKIPEVN